MQLLIQKINYDKQCQLVYMVKIKKNEYIEYINNHKKTLEIHGWQNLNVWLVCRGGVLYQLV